MSGKRRPRGARSQPQLDRQLDPIDTRHKILGEADFLQDDPRRWFEPPTDWMLLLRLDSDPAAGMDWNDGHLNFWIRADMLARHDFSDVRIDWQFD